MAETAPTPAKDVSTGAESEEHLSHLARLQGMSRTAGLNSQEYVAVNALSIAALLLALAAVVLWVALEFSFLGFLLALPLAGVIAAIVALRQIGHSNGTQTGRALAWSGLALGVLVGGASGAVEMKHRADARQDEQAVAKVIDDLGKAVRAGDYGKAYALFDPDFQDLWKPVEFKAAWEGLQKLPRVGKLEKFEWNQVPPQPGGDAGGKPTILAQAIAKFQQTADDRFPIQFRKHGDEWRVLDFPSLFQSDRKRKAEGK